VHFDVISGFARANYICQKGYKKSHRTIDSTGKTRINKENKKELVTGIEPVNKKPIIVVVIGFLKFPWEV
jgi:hypothetical protein